MESLLHFAKSIVREASLLVKGMSHLSTVRYPKDGGDLVTDGDLAVHEYVLGGIRYAYPDHAILSEEDDDHSVEADNVWILDPIDGTKYFSRNVPLYAISLALKVKGELVVGVVHNPETQQMFAAAKGIGATLNGKKIMCSERTDLKECIIAMESPGRHDPVEEREWNFEQVKLLTNHVNRIRMIGVVAHSLCWTAMGGFDAYVNLKRNINTWDIAAGQVIAQEAGAKTSFYDGRMITAPAVIHDKIVELLKL